MSEIPRVYTWAEYQAKVKAKREAEELSKEVDRYLWEKRANKQIEANKHKENKNE